MRTIQTTFNPKSLPRWAQTRPAVVDKCRRDLAYRCNVCSAMTRQVRQQLIRDAER